jgi:hypothetical protein
MFDEAAASTDDGVDEEHGTRTLTLPLLVGQDSRDEPWMCELEPRMRTRRGLEDAKTRRNAAPISAFASLTRVRYVPTVKRTAAISM